MRGTAAGPGSRSPTRSVSRGRRSTRSTPDRGGIAEMFERFTEEARRVVVLAQEEARTARDPSIDGAHLLLGIALTGGAGAQAVEGAGGDGVRRRRGGREGGGPGGALDAGAPAAPGHGRR